MNDTLPENIIDDEYIDYCMEFMYLPSGSLEQPMSRLEYGALVSSLYNILDRIQMATENVVDKIMIGDRLDEV